MTAATPPPLDFPAQVARFLGHSPPTGPNWPYQAVLQAVRTPEPVSPRVSGQETAYSQLLREQTALAIQDLTSGGESWLGEIEAVFLSGPAALGTARVFRTEVAGEPLPPETARLWGLVYDWLFTFLGKSPDLNGTRFLDPDLTDPVELVFYVSSPDLLPEVDLIARVKAAFLSRANFVPPMDCRLAATETLTPRTSLAGVCLLGWETVEARLRQAWRGAEDQALQAQFRQAVREARGKIEVGRAGLGPLAAAVDRRIVDHYRCVMQASEPGVALDLLPIPRAQASPWREKNRAFFEHLLAGRYDRLLVEDATKMLEDRKGIEKENQFTISRVLGLEVNGAVIPAHEMVLKLRGFTHYRGDINNWIDLLKEYASYLYIHRQVGAPSEYLPEVGPLLLTCERLAVPFEPEETRRWIGFFMESLTVLPSGGLFTCRAHYLSDFWAPERAEGRVMWAAQRAGVTVERRSLREHLRKLALWLWQHNLSIDFCDVILLMGRGGRVEAVRLIDLERLSFSELVGEEHLLLDTLIDIKTHLRKEPWVHVLLNMYRAKVDPQGFPSLAALQENLKPKRRGRQLRLRAWRGLRKVCLGLGRSRGLSWWARLIAARARLSDVFLRP